MTEHQDLQGGTAENDMPDPASLTPEESNRWAEALDGRPRSTAENDAGCVECGSPVDRVLPDPIPEGYECMWSEAMTGRALYCDACYSVIPPGE